MIPPATRLAPDDLASATAASVRQGKRFAGLLASARPDGSTELEALLAGGGALTRLQSRLASGVTEYPALTPLVPAAAWYEREIHDLFGLVAVGHPRLSPLVLPLAGPSPARPRPGTGGSEPATPLKPDPGMLPAHVAGEGVFTIAYGPVRSGVFESVEYLVETVGEDIPHVRTRVYHKHRGLEHRFERLPVDQAVLLAERVEGTASVAHATAFCQALETLSAASPPRRALLLRAVHLELERIAAHLDSIVRHTEAAGQAVAFARMGLHKERVMRLRSALCGNRFGRAVVQPGGVRAGPACPPDEARVAANALDSAIARDLRLLMATPSFIDRLRGTGVLPPGLVAEQGGLGPLGRGSGQHEDIRQSRPYGAYTALGFDPAPPEQEGDALARQRVRIEELHQSFHLVRQALDELAEAGAGPWSQPVDPGDGAALGWVEAPQGELLYLVEVQGGRLCRVKPRTASFHNLALFPRAFRGDITTDFAFIEASFGLSIAGVSG
jgi:formate hydrogenlyase subunit 5